MDDWDPRKAAFDDKNFNSYDRGPGKYIPRNQDISQGIKLYVTGFPKDLSDAGLENLFSRAGNVLKANVVESKLPNSKTKFGFVTMGSLAEAEEAIRQLHNFRLSECNLRVQIAQSDADREKRRRERMDQEEFLNSLPSSRMAQSKSNGTWGSDSDSDRISLKNERTRTVVNGNAHYPNDKRSGMKMGMRGQGSKVIPDPSCMPVQKRRSNLSDRFNDIEDDDFDRMSSISNTSYGRGQPLTRGPPFGDQMRGRGMGQGIFHDGRTFSPDYNQGNRGYRQGAFHGPPNNYDGGYGGGYRPLRGYGQGFPNVQQGYGRGYEKFQQDYGQGYQNYQQGYGRGYHNYQQGYGRGKNMYKNYIYPNASGDFQGYNEYEDGYDYNEGYGHSHDQGYQQPRHSSPTYQGYRQGGGQGRRLDSSMRSYQGSSHKTVKPSKVDPRPCNVCRNIGSFQCSKCKTPYCSADCQKNDWPEHKDLCKSLRASNDFSHAFENQFEISVGDEMVEKMKNTVSNATGETVSCQQKKSPNYPQGNQPRNKQPSPKSTDGGQIKKQQPRPNTQPISNFKSNYTSPRQQQSPKKQSFVSQRPSQNQRKESPKAVLPAQEIQYSQLPLNTETQVLVVAVTSPDHIAVQLADGVIARAGLELAERMNTVYSNTTDAVKTPQTGLVYAVQFSEDKNWYRARVDSIDVTTADVTYIDYGNKEKVPFQRFRELKPDMVSMKAMAIICQLAGILPKEKTWSQSAIVKMNTLLVSSAVNQMLYPVTATAVYGYTFKIKILGTNEKDVAETLVQEGFAVRQDSLACGPVILPESSTVIMTTDIQKPSSLVSVGDTITVLVTEKQSPVLFYGQMTEHDIPQKFSELTIQLEKDMASNTSAYRPIQVGEIVFAQYVDGSWYRAEVLALSKEVASCLFIDYGNKSDVSYSLIRTATDLCKTSPQVAAKMKFAGVTKQNSWSQDTLQLFDILLPVDPVNAQLVALEVKAVSDDTIEVDFLHDNRESAAGLILQSLSPEEKEGKLPTVKAVNIPMTVLPAGSKVDNMIITHVDLEGNKIYLQKADVVAEVEALVGKMTADGKSFCSLYIPEVGELVCAQFPDDGSWYRAHVLSLSGVGADIECEVQFVDYGNSSTATSKTMMKIKQEFTTLPRQAVCCCMKNIPLSELNENEKGTFATKAMNQLISILAHELKADVYESTLYQADGTDINYLIRPKNVLETVNIPKVATTISAEQKVMTNSVSQITLPVGGSKVSGLIITDADKINNKIYLQKQDSVASVEAVGVEMTAIGNSITARYTPVVGELVSAQFSDDGQWYRANVLEICGDEIKVQFVDYGNISVTKPTHVFQIPSKFTALPRQAVCCRLKNISLKDLNETEINTFAYNAMNTLLTVQGCSMIDGTYETIFYKADGTNINSLVRPAATCPIGNDGDNPGPPIFASSIPLENIPIDGSQIDVLLTELLMNLELAYIQIFSDEYKEKLLTFTEELQYFCQAAPSGYTPSKGEIVCAKFEDGVWYRANVTEVNGDKYTVHFIDYGNLSTVTPSSICRINTKFAAMPKQALCCTIVGVKFNELSQDKLAQFAGLTMNQVIKLQALKKSEDQYDIELFSVDGNCINTLFGNVPEGKQPIMNGGSNLTSSLPTQAKESVVMAKDLQLLALPSDGSKVDMMIADASGLDKIYLQFPSEEQKLVDLQVAIKEHCETKASPHVPVKGELVLGIFEGEWYRAEVLDSKDGNYHLLYVDFGNTSKVNSESIQKLPNILSGAPLSAVCCTLHKVDLKSCSPELITLFSQLAMNKTIKVQSVSFSDQCYEVILFTEEGININEQLQVPKAATVEPVILAKTVPMLNISNNGEQVDAVLSEVLEDCSFYLQPNIGVSREALNKILSHCMEYCNSNPHAYTPQQGELVCTQFSIDKVWYRTAVEDVVDGKYLVHFIDSGNKDLVTEESIRKVDQSFAVDPVQCIKCVLNDVPKSEDVRAHLSSLANVEINVTVVKKEADVYHVVLISNNVNLNEQFQKPPKTPTGGRPSVADQLQKSTSPLNKTEQIKQQPLVDAAVGGSKYLSLRDVAKTDLAESSSVNVVITHSVSPSEFYCQIADLNAIESLAAVMQSMMCRCEIDDPDRTFKPQKNDLVCAFYPADKGWYRGSVVEVYPDGSYCVHYCDFGNMEMLKADQVRSMLPEYINMPIRAFKCSLADIAPLGSDWDSAIKEKMKVFQGNQLKAKIMKKSGDSYIIKLVIIDENTSQEFDVASELIAAGLAKKPSTEPTGIANVAGLQGAADPDALKEQIALLQAQLAASLKTS